jgi:predicted Zn-dependent protease
MGRHLSTAEVARILGAKEARIREMVRSGLCRPTRRGHRYAFSFQDLVVLRAAQQLHARGVPAARVRRALATILRELPPHRSLSAVRIYADGREVAVCDGDASWLPETGQTLLDFEEAALARLVAAVRPAEAAACARADASPLQRARRELERALDLEDDDPKAAAAAYGRALELDPELVDAYVNLGRIAHEHGEPTEAERLYRAALARSPDDPIIHFNLALALEDTRGAVPAIAHYERALALDPAFADAHYNVAGLYEQSGRKVDALRHYRAYQKLTQR